MDIVFVIGVNPMSQSSQSALSNPVLMMCQNIQSNPSLSASLGAGFPAGFPMYNRYLYHYCYMDPEEVRPCFHSQYQQFVLSRLFIFQAVAFVLGILVVVALSLSAYYAYKTRSKIWRHGKDNIYWDQPVVAPSQGRDAAGWVGVCIYLNYTHTHIHTPVNVYMDPRFLLPSAVDSKDARFVLGPPRFHSG